MRIAGGIVQQTYAAQQAGPDATALMRQVFELRASKLAAIRRAGRLGWIRETGARPRMLESVVANRFFLFGRHGTTSKRRRIQRSYARFSVGHGTYPT